MANEHFNQLKAAFETDGFGVVDLKNDERFKGKIPDKFLADEGYVYLNDEKAEQKIGILAEHKTIKTVTGLPKRAYYLEGNNYQMGLMLGLMTEPEIHRMAYEYVDNVVFDFFKKEIPAWLKNLLKGVIVKIMYPASEDVFERFVPQEYKDELTGMTEGCKLVNGKTDEDELTKRLKVLNFGVDCLLAHIYTGKLHAAKTFKIPPFLLKIPVMCNALSISGDVVKNNGHYFGRDFMFPTAGVFQDVACVIIYNPDGSDLPLLSQTAPGFLGSIAAVNSGGAAIGVDMSPSAFCDVENPGLNTLLLNRSSLHASKDMERLKSYMIDAQRGVSWLYPTAHGESRTSCVFETGIRQKEFPYLDYITDIPLTDYPLNYLPNKKRIEEIRHSFKDAPAPKMGLVARSGNYNADFTLEFNNQFNKNLWDHYPLWLLYNVLQASLAMLEEIEKQGELHIEHILEHMAGFFHTGIASTFTHSGDAQEETSKLFGKLLGYVNIGQITNWQNMKIEAAAQNKAPTIEEVVRELNDLIRTERYNAVHEFFRGALGKNLNLNVPAEDREKIKTLNELLLERTRPFCRKVQYDPNWFGERSYINKAVDNEKGFQLEENCPGPYYFAPQREKIDNVTLVSNHCISPEMRLTAMTLWLNIVTGNDLNDLQWRYDELNNQILAAVDNANKADNSEKIDETIAWKLINFLSPEPGYKFPHYYNKNPQVPWQTIEIGGSVSLFDLETKTIKTKFGYYGDKPITITLPNYLRPGKL